uniref:Uncharacterized protein n=1 Tax=Branchiostoma floridae TaxID=7739 RepID=C3YUR7_BRAFL|eukprot:XP_002599956.1 hypothetical protein BRAFLDRAFT_74078 [Branchiostoma floridae]
MQGSYSTIADTVDAPTPGPCCTPTQWSGTLRLISSSVSGGRLSTTNQTMQYYYDYENMKVATVGEGFRIVDDFNKMVKYSIFYGTCTTSSLLKPLLNCVPANVSFVGSFQYGGPQGFQVNEYFDGAFGPNTTRRNAYTTDSCIPVREILVSTGQAPVVVSEEFVDIVPSIEDPSVFDIPSPPCPNVTDVDSAAESSTTETTTGQGTFEDQTGTYSTTTDPLDDSTPGPCCAPKQWSGTMRITSSSVIDGKLTKAAFVGSYQYGGPQGFYVNEYFDDTFGPNTTRRNSYTADGCIAVLETLVATGPAPLVVTIEFVDIVPSIEDPSVFDITSPPCPTVSSDRQRQCD